MLKKYKNYISVLFQKNDLSTEAGRGREREKRIALSALLAAVAKVFNTAIPLITLKITIGYLGTELYGLWATVISFFALFAFADLGLGNGLQTELSRATGRDDIKQCRTLISSAYLVLTIVPAFLLALLFVVYPFVNWGHLMNAESEEAMSLAGPFVLALFSSKMISVPASLVQRIHNSLQEGYVASIWSCISSVVSLITIFLYWKCDLGKTGMMWASSYAIVLVYLMNTFYFFFVTKKEYRPSLKAINKDISIRLFTTGSLFLALHVLTSVSLSLDSFIVAKTVGLTDTASYSVAYRVALFIGIISTMLSTPLWAASGEALERGDINWVKSRTRKMMGLSMCGAIIVTVVLLLVSNPVLSWLGKDLFISAPVLLGMCLTQILMATVSPAFMVLNASRRIVVQIVMFTIYAAVSLILKYILGKYFGTIAISWCGALSYLLIIVPSVFIAYKKTLTGAEKFSQ